ncbi:MAG: M23 family metallopeptidase [Clostridia bacterium]|nr:M23 family metallopeptidase [Clostridia bacterium]
MAMHRMNEQDKEKKKSGRGGFYAALAICVLAIGIAAWSTYDTMSGFLTPTDTDGAKNTVRDTLTAIEPADDPEDTVTAGHAHGTTSAVPAEPEPSDVPKSEAAGRAEIEPEKPAAEPAAAPTEESEPAEPTAAEPASYRVSERFVYPVSSGEVLAAYTDIPVYSETMRDYRVHLGMDLKAKRGETVKAAANGIVKDAYTDMLLGNILVIEHGDVEIRYCGLGETFLVKPGEVVTAGQDIGSVTAAPFESAMETHLHLEAAENGQVIDPASLF